MDKLKKFFGGASHTRKEGRLSRSDNPDVSMRPKAWHTLWLDKKREMMVKGLQCHVMAIADRLVQGR